MIAGPRRLRRRRIGEHAPALRKQERPRQAEREVATGDPRARAGQPLLEGIERRQPLVRVDAQASPWPRPGGCLDERPTASVIGLRARGALLKSMPTIFMRASARLDGGLSRPAGAPAPDASRRRATSSIACTLLHEKQRGAACCHGSHR